MPSRPTARKRRHPRGGGGTGPWWNWTEDAGERKAAVWTAAFQESDRELKNPSRGLYCVKEFVIEDQPKGLGYYMTDIGWHCSPVSGLEKYEGHTLGLAKIDLSKYRDRELSQAALDEIDVILDVWAEYGHKVILRFCYGVDGWATVDDSREPDDIGTIIQHMEQLGSVLVKHADTIFTIQGLFIGAWGEMHATRFGSVDDMRLLAGKLAEMTDIGTYLAVRTPTQWRAITMDGEVEELAGRMGLYNDGMLGSESDLGTYLENCYPLEDGGGRRYRADELAFQDKLCAEVPNGGQVVGVVNRDGKTVADGLYNNFDNAVRDMSLMHTTYIDQNWRKEVLEAWDGVVLSEDWGCFAGKTGLDYIRSHLGYRLLIDEVDVSPGSSPEDVEMSVYFRNVGFAPLYGGPEVTLRLVDARNRTVRTVRMDHELAALSGGTQAGDVGLAQAVVLLEGLADGTYRIFVDLSVEGTCGKPVPVLLANEQDRDRDGYFIGTVELFTYGAGSAPGMEGFFITGGMLAVCAFLVIKRRGRLESR